MRLSLIAFKYLLVCLLSGRMLESEWPEWWKRKAMWEGWTTVIFFWDFTHLDHWLGCSLKETKNCKWILAALGKYIEYFSVYFLSIRENKSPWKKNKTPDTAAFIICRNSDESEFAIWFPGCEVRFLGDWERSIQKSLDNYSGTANCLLYLGTVVEKAIIKCIFKNANEIRVICIIMIMMTGEQFELFSYFLCVSIF